jgi:hypothetical protein
MSSTSHACVVAPEIVMMSVGGVVAVHVFGRSRESSTGFSGIADPRPAALAQVCRIT